MKSGLVLSAFAAAFVMAGCASVAKVPYDRMSAGNIKTIGIATPSIPAEASVRMVIAPRQKHGMVGPLADTMRANILKEMIRTQNVSVPETFLSRLAERLESHGYSVARVSTPRSGTGFIDDYPNAAAVDAYLDVVVTNYGYIAAGSTSNMPYLPRFQAKVRLVRGSDAAVLMQDTIIYNAYESLNETKGAVTIPANTSYAYPHFTEAVANSEQAVTGLKEAALQSADTIANLLR